MRFNLIDRIVELEPGVRIKAIKTLSMAEEYLADHFPNFPVMPGVLMLEALTQASAWLIRVSEQFSHGVVLLRRAQNVKYGRFLEPGQSLNVEAEIVEMGESEVRLKARATMDDRTTVSARLVMVRYDLADTDPSRADLDEHIRDHFRKLFPVIYPSAANISQSPA